MATSKQILDEATNMGMSGIDRAIEKRRRTGEGVEKDKLKYSHAYEDARNEYLREARRPTGLTGVEGLKDKEPIVVEKKKGGKISSASKRADGCCIRGKTKGRYL